jgi:23S rRNA (cytidine1920-2'-O)/16S rRNA (cytidine1409-2'-O)-methyltransferase
MPGRITAHISGFPLPNWIPHWAAEAANAREKKTILNRSIDLIGFAVGRCAWVARSYSDAVEVRNFTRGGYSLVMSKPASNAASSLNLAPRGPLRGQIKLGAGLDLFAVNAQGAVALDVGASTGGFTKALLDAGASRVYAVDAGHGQLLGSLRQDPRVVNLERVNVGALEKTHVPEEVDLVTVDVSYLSLSSAVEQLSSRVALRAGATLLGLVKPMFELRLPTAPTDSATAEKAMAQAELAIASAGWRIKASALSPVLGSKGAVEGWICAERTGIGRR